MTVLPLYIHPVRALWAREQSSASKYWINTWGRTYLISAYWLFCGCASNSTKRLFWRLYRLFLIIGYLPYTVMHLVWPQKFAQSWFSISPRYYSRPKRNRKQWWCKFLGGNQGALKWPVQGFHTTSTGTIYPPKFLLSWSHVLEQLKTYILKKFSLRQGSSLEFLTFCVTRHLHGGREWLFWGRGGWGVWTVLVKGKALFLCLCVPRGMNSRFRGKTR